jgi:hypothetical protein
VNLVDHDELGNLCAQKCVRVLKAPLISRALEVKVYRPPLAQVSDLASKRGFAHLAGAEKNDPRHSPQAFLDEGAESSYNYFTPVF